MSNAPKKSVTTHTRADGQQQSVNRIGGEFDNGRAAGASSAAEPFAKPTIAELRTQAIERRDELRAEELVAWMAVHASDAGRPVQVFASQDLPTGLFGSGQPGEPVIFEPGHPDEPMRPELKYLMVDLLERAKPGSEGLQVSLSFEEGDRLYDSELLMVGSGEVTELGDHLAEPGESDERTLENARQLSEDRRVQEHLVEQLAFANLLDTVGADRVSVMPMTGRDRGALQLTDGPYVGTLMEPIDAAEREAFAMDHWSEIDRVEIARTEDGCSITVDSRTIFDGEPYRSRTDVSADRPTAWTVPPDELGEGSMYADEDDH